MSNDQEKQIKLMELVQETIKCDEALRTKYQIEDKFRFIKERLKLLLEQIQKELDVTLAEAKEHQFVLGADEVLVHVHLFNAKGLQLRTWKNMVLPKVFYEYSVNRPVYAEKKEIEAMINAKPDKMQHGYLTVAINKKDLMSSMGKDALGNSLIKVKEGALRFERLLTFVHNAQEYILNEEGEFVKK